MLPNVSLMDVMDDVLPFFDYLPSWKIAAKKVSPLNLYDLFRVLRIF